MGAIGQYLRERREEAELTQAELARRIGVDPTVISKWETGRRKPNYAERKRLATELGLTAQQFDEGWRRWGVELTQGEPGKIPVINKAPAGLPANYEEYGVDSGQGYDYVDRGGIVERDAFGIIVVGDSMEPRFFEGDLLICAPVPPTPQASVTIDGKEVFVRFTEDKPYDGTGMLAIIHRRDDGKIELKKANRKYKPTVVEPQHIARVNRVVQLRTDLYDRTR